MPEVKEKDAPEADEVVVNPEEIAGQIQHIQSLAKVDPSLTETAEYKALLASAEKVRAAGGGEEEEEEAEESEEEEEESDEEEEAEEEEEEEPADSKKKGSDAKKKDAAGKKSSAAKKEKSKDDDDEEEGDEDEEDEDEKPDPNDIFGIRQKKGEKTKVDVAFGDKEKAFIEKRYAIKDESTFFASVDGWRKDAQKYKELHEEYQELVEGINDLPVPIKKAIQLFGNGGDYTQAMNVKTIDLNLDFEKQKAENVVAYYYADKLKTLQEKLDKDDIDDDQYEERINDLKDSAKRLFETDKKTFEKERAELIKKQEENIRALKDSAVGSVEQLKKKYPYFKSAELQRIKQVLVNGGVEGLIKEKNGNYLPNAAEMIAWMLYGDKYIGDSVEKAEKKAESKVTQEMVHRSKKKIAKKGGQGGADAKPNLEAVAHLTPMLTKTDPYA